MTLREEIGIQLHGGGELAQHAHSPRLPRGTGTNSEAAFLGSTVPSLGSTWQLEQYETLTHLPELHVCLPSCLKAEISH